MRLLTTACALVALAAPLWGQAPARDATPLTTVVRGTGQLTVVVSTDEPVSRPLRRVSVAIQTGELDLPHIGVTGDDGRVVFRELAAGNYLVVASRAGYVRAHYGASQPGRGPGVPVSVVEGQRTGEIRMKMLRGGVITGVIRNTSGRPAANQQVRAIMVRSSGGERRAVNIEDSVTSLVTTDDRGMYRIFGLAPGDYLVSLPLVSLVGQDVRPVTSAELAWADKVVASRGRAGAPAVTDAPAGGQSVRYSPVYYPGTTVAAEASVVTLGPNEERAGLDFGLLLVPTAQIRGRVIDAENRPQSGMTIRLEPSRPDGLDLFASLSTSSGRSGADGSFAIQGLKPGSYTLSVRGTPNTSAGATTAPPAPAGPMSALVGAGRGAGVTHWASEDIVMEGRDITDLTLTLRPGMTMRGRVVYEATTRTPPTDYSRVMLGLISTTGTEGSNPAAGLLGTGVGEVRIAPDGTFLVTGIAPGRYRLNSPLAMLPQATAALFGMMSGGWTLKSVVADGRDIADAPIEIRPGVDVSNVVVTFTDQPSELSGTVLDATGRPTPGFPIVVFSTNRAAWTNGSSRVQQVRPATNGRFTVTGLPAGEYFVCAVTSVDRLEVYDPAFLEQLIPGSFKITIADGEKKTQDLKLGGG